MILLDLMMPVLNGWEFAHTLEEDPGLRDIPIVVISAYANVGRPVPHCSSMLEKPLDLSVLLEAVQDAIAAIRNHDQ